MSYCECFAIDAFPHLRKGLKMKKISLWSVATKCLSLTFVSLTGHRLNAVDCSTNGPVNDSKCVSVNTNFYPIPPQGGGAIDSVFMQSGFWWVNCGGGGNNSCAGQTQIETVKKRRHCSAEGSYNGQGPCRDNTSFTTKKQLRTLKCKGSYDTGIGTASGKNPPAVGSACPCIRGGSDSEAPAANQETFCVCS